MKENYWLERWQSRDIGFHYTQPNPLLVNNLNSLRLEFESNIFVPLCGKTVDIHWLLSQGYHVIGVEMSEIAVNELFQELNISPKIVKQHSLTIFTFEKLTIYLGDFFKIELDDLPRIDAVYDRAALIAFPKNQQTAYTAHLQKITDFSKQLLICFNYDQSLMEGPPFSTDLSRIEELYQHKFHIHSLDSIPVKGGLKGCYPADEQAWLLSPRS